MYFKMMKRLNLLAGCLVVLCVLLSSCATASFSKYKGVGRVKRYDFYSAQLPDSFDGFRVAFVSDFHYESRFTSRRLPGMCQALRSVETPCGTYAVMGNHERGQADSLARKAMQETGVHLLEHKVDTLWRGKEYILLCGIRNPFDLKQNGVSPTLALQEEDFVLMLVHTPDYVEDVNVAHTDLALAGHTHGGQVSLFRRWTPAHFSKYGNRFLTGLKYNSAGIPVIITNGLGTSRKDVRLFTPSEVVLVVLHKKK